MEGGADIGVGLGAVAKGAEALRGLRLSISVEFEDEVADLLLTGGHGHENTGVLLARVVVEGRESALASVEELN